MKKPTKKKLKEIATIERAIKGKLYEKGTPLVALSASMEADKGGITYVKETGEVESRWAVIVPKDNNMPMKYLYYAMLKEYDEFYSKYNTGINLQIRELDYYEVCIHDDLESQYAVVELMEAQEKHEENERQILEQFIKVKQYFIDKMFI